MLWKKGMNFCDISPTCYAISVKKEILKRHIKNLMSSDKLAKTKSDEILPNVVSSHSSNMIKRAPGVDLTLQLNKAVNIDLAGSKINGIVIRPGETFSFWDAVGKITKKKGYKEGRVLKNNKLIAGMGGGLCNLSNTLHLLILHSPLEVTEFHKHSDALAPDEGKRKPFSAGTSVSYNNLDYRFKNNTDQNVQLIVRCEGETLIAELRSEKPYPYRYELFEEDHHFRMEGEVFYRNSMIYRNVFDAQTDELVEKEFVHKNHSKVMFDYDLIPKELIRK
ncbi:MAG: VanW family protein [Clostridia bacterium]|nr:VanW family protein [Clostridia bacterium]